MNYVRVSVTADDIWDARNLDPFACPVKRAVRRLTGIKETEVGHERCVMTGLGTMFMFYLPRSARQFVRGFDNGDLVEPFTFRAAVDSRVAELFRRKQ